MPDISQENSVGVGADSLLLDSISTGVPCVLVLGQEGWVNQDGIDPILSLTLEHLRREPTPTQSWKQLLDEALPEDFYLWLAERFSRRPYPPWLIEVATLPWSAVFSCSLDSTLVQTFASNQREPQAILTSSEVPVSGRSTARTPIYFLFGRAGASDAQASSPRTQQEMRRRYNMHCVPMLNRIPDTTSPVGLLVIDGYSPDADWLPDEALLTVIEQLPKGHVLWCGINQQSSISGELRQLIQNGHVIGTPQRLGLIVAELRARGRLNDVPALLHSDQTNVVSFATGPKTVSSYSPPPELRIRVEASAAIVDDSWTSFMSPLGDEAEYAAFRRFHGDVEGSRSLVTGVRRGFAITRDFEKQLWAVVEDAVENHSRFTDPIILHGQSGTGKSIALARVVALLRERRKIPVLYASSRIPMSTDVQAFCEEVEAERAPVTVIVCDNNAPIHRYRDLLSGLQSRGRKVVLVCSSYRQIDLQPPLPPTLVDAPEGLSDRERSELETLTTRFGLGLPKLPHATDRHFLVALYHLLPPSRVRLSSGLGKETRWAEQELRERARTAGKIRPQSGTLMRDRLLDAGYEDSGNQILTNCVDDALQGIDDDAGRLINLVMVPGQLGCGVPIDVVVRALDSSTNGINIETIAHLFQGLDLFRWRNGETAEDLLVCPRLTFEAEIICRRRMLNAASEGACLVHLIKATRLGWDAGGNERRFLLELLQRMGPDGPREERYKDSYLPAARALTELRQNYGVVDPSLMLQESVLRRSSIRVGAVDLGLRLEVLEEARSAVQSALEFVDSQRTGSARRMKANLVVERATIFGYLAIQQNELSAPLEDVWSAYLAARTAAKAAVGISQTYFPLDVSLWIPADLLKLSELPEVYRLELTADIRSVLDRIDPSTFPVEQKLKYNQRKFILGQVLSDDVVSDSAFDALIKQGSTAGYLLRARSMGPAFGADAPDQAGPNDIELANAALVFLTKHWNAIQSDDRCLRYYLQCRWLRSVGQRLFRGSRSPLPSEEVDRREILRIVEMINAIAALGADNSLLYLQAVLAWLVNEDRFAIDTWKDLSRETEFYDPRRVIRLHTITDSGGSPVLFSGRIENESDPFSIRVDGLNKMVKLLQKDFLGYDVAYGRQVSGFAIAFNYIGPIADPQIRKAGR